MAEPRVVPAGEPEKLALPAPAVERLLLLALRTEPGGQWWDGFLCAHGYPAWTQTGRWRLVTGDGALVPIRSDAEGADAEGEEEA